MALNLGELVGYMRMDANGWIDGVSKAATKTEWFGGNVPNWMGVAAIGVATAGAAIGYSLYQLGSTFDDVADTIRIGTGATGEALDDLVDSAKKVGSQIPVEWEKVGPAIADVNTRLGLTGDTLETVAAQFLEAGRVLGEDVDIQQTTGALSAFKIEGEAVTGALDFLFQTSQATGIGMNDLAARVAAAAPITQQLGWTFEETAGMIGTFDKAGLDSQNMIGAMQRGLAQMTEPGEQASDTFRRVVDEIQGFIDAGDEASARQAAADLFGTRGAAQFVGALQSGALSMDDLAAAATLSGDSILDAAADTNDFAEKWQIVQNKAAAALEPLGSAVFNALGDALDMVMPGLTAIGDWMTANPEAVQTIAVILGVLAAAFLVATIAVWAMNAALYANPITWIIVAIVALIAIIVLLVIYWDEVVAFLSDIWAGFVGWITDLIDGFAGWWNDTWAAIGAFFSDLWNGLVAGVQAIWDGYIAWVRGIVLGFMGWWNSTWQEIGDFFGTLWTNVVAGARAIWDGLIGWFQSVPGMILDVFTGAATWLYNIGRDVLQGLWNGLTSIWNGLIGWISDIGESIANTFAGVLGIASPSRVFRGFGRNIGEGLMLGLADMEPELDAQVAAFAGGVTDAGRPGDAATSQDNSRHVTVQMFSDRTALDEEDLFAALGRGRAEGD